MLKIYVYNWKQFKTQILDTLGYFKDDFKLTGGEGTCVHPAPAPKK